jgi:hypothetical protein
VQSGRAASRAGDKVVAIDLLADDELLTTLDLAIG